MGRQIALFFTALQFLTRLPTPSFRDFQPDWVSRSARYFPLVGQVVGGLSALTVLAASHIWPAPVAALLAIGVGVLITGAFHEDGLADTADGLGGGQTPAARLTIMKDSRVGTYGVLALGLCLGLKATILATLPPLAGALALFAAHSTARGAAVVAMRATPYAGDADAAKWKPVPGRIGWNELSIALLLAVWPLVLLRPGAAGLGLALGSGLAIAIASLARRLIGGHTGDVLGAVEQMFELGFLLGVAALR